MNPCQGCEYYNTEIGACIPKKQPFNCIMYDEKPARRITEQEKLEIVLNKCKGKRVLHVGFVGEWHITKEDIIKSEFYKIKQASSECIGIDTNTKGVRYFKKLGFQVKKGNCENQLFKEKFDVIYACNVIEHLNNPGQFIKTSLKNLKHGAELIITTGNPYSINTTMRNIFGASDAGIITDHTTWISPQNIRVLLQRQKQTINETYYYTNIDWRNNKTKFISRIIGFLAFIMTYNEEYMITVRKR